MAKEKRQELTEEQMTALICDYLTARKILHWRDRQMSGKVRRGWKFTKGTPDINAIYLKRYVGFEVKTLNNDASQCQEQWHMKVREAGGYVFVVRNLRDVDDGLSTVRMGERR